MIFGDERGWCWRLNGEVGNGDCLGWLGWPGCSSFGLDPSRRPSKSFVGSCFTGVEVCLPMTGMESLGAVLWMENVGVLGMLRRSTPGTKGVGTLSSLSGIGVEEVRWE